MLKNLTFLLTLTVLLIDSSKENVPFNQPIKGRITFYTTKGKGSCGYDVNPNTDFSASIGSDYWTVGSNE